MVEIVDYELFRLPPRFLLLRLETAKGVVGWGEPSLEGHLKPVAAAVENFLERYIIGTRIDSMENTWQKMYRTGYYRGGPVLMSAIAGIDHALWDIRGKIRSAPVYELLGGKSRNKVRVQRWIGGNSLEKLLEETNEAMDEGMVSIKMDAISKTQRVDSPNIVKKAEQRLSEVRRTVGDEVTIGVDLHGRASKSMAKQLVASLEQYWPMFYEEPVLPKQNESLSEIARYTTVPLATGERLYSRWDFKKVFNQDCLDVAQPNICHAGGISELQKIANVAEAHDIGISPIYPGGPISFLACLHLDMHIPNFGIQQYSRSTDLLSDIGDFGYQFTNDGYIEVAERPGLGITIDDDALEERSSESIDWQNPTWRHEDGSIAEW